MGRFKQLSAFAFVFEREREKAAALRVSVIRLAMRFICPRPRCNQFRIMSTAKCLRVRRCAALQTGGEEGGGRGGRDPRGKESRRDKGGDEELLHVVCAEASSRYRAAGSAERS